MKVGVKIGQKISYFIHVTLRNAPWNFVRIKGKSGIPKKIFVIGIVRERNEGLLLRDTLDHVAQFVDGVIVFDDDSSDDSVKVARNHPIVLEVIKNKKWRKKSRKWEETSNRKALQRRAMSYGPQWLFYFDADERFEGDIRSFLENADSSIEGVRVSLLDAYITPDDRDDFTENDQLLNFRKKFGIERRDILMIWRAGSRARYVYPDSREPACIDPGSIVTNFWCQHYGKAVSIQQWEDTCLYYAENFPMYAEKWRARMGKAVHERSDFDTPLYTWKVAKEKSILL